MEAYYPVLWLVIFLAGMAVLGQIVQVIRDRRNKAFQREAAARRLANTRPIVEKALLQELGPMPPDLLAARVSFVMQAPTVSNRPKKYDPELSIQHSAADLLLLARAAQRIHHAEDVAPCIAALTQSIKSIERPKYRDPDPSPLPAKSEWISVHDPGTPRGNTDYWRSLGEEETDMVLSGYSYSITDYTETHRLLMRWAAPESEALQR